MNVLDFLNQLGLDPEFLRRLPQTFWEGNKLTTEQVINFYNRGCGKNIDEIWEEDPVEALGNMLKLVQPDTGGTQGDVPQACIDEVLQIAEKIKSKKDPEESLQAAGAYVYWLKDTRSKAIRLSQIKRNALVRVKIRNGTIQDYYAELARMVNQTLDDYRKLHKRQKLANTDIIEEAKKCSSGDND